MQADSSVRLARVDLATIAAFTAAVISLLNVIVTARLARRGGLERWRREEMRPVVAGILAFSREALAEWDSLTLTRILWLGMHDDPAKAVERERFQLRDLDKWEVGHETVAKLRLEVAKLDLIAHRPARKAAQALLQAHQDMSDRLLREHEPDAAPEVAANTMQAFREDRARLEDDLIENTRADLGLASTAVAIR